MKLLFRLFAVGALLTAACSFAAKTFEGKVTLNMSAGKKGGQTMNYSIKGQKLRMDIDTDGHQIMTIMDMEKLEMLMLMPDQKKYMVMPIKKPIEEAVAKHGESTAVVEVTGKTETILGYKCNQILVKDKGVTTEVWMAEDLGMFMGLGNSGGNPMAGMFGGKAKAAPSGWEEQFKGKAGFPLRVISLDAKNKETFRMEATKIEPGNLPASLFVPPAGYEKFQMPDFGSLNPFKKG